MTIAFFSTTTPHYIHTTTLRDLGYVFGKRNIPFRYYPNPLSDIVRKDYLSEEKAALIDTLETTPPTTTQSRLEEVMPFLLASGMQEHYHEYRTHYIDAFHLLMGDDGYSPVKRCFVWMSPDDTLHPIVRVANHLKISCVNLASPATLREVEDWTMQHTLPF